MKQINSFYKEEESKIKRKEKKNGFMEGVIVLMFSQVIVKVVGLIYKLYLTNKEGFGDRGNAIYSSGFQIYALFLTVCSIGVPNAISKLVSSKVAIGDNKGAYRIFKIAFALFGFLGFICSSILFFGANYISDIYLQIPEAEMTILALSPSVFLVSIASVLRGYFNGRENLSVTANSQSLEQIFKTLFTILIVEQVANLSSNNTILMAAGATIATTIATLFSVIYLYKYFIKRKKTMWQEVISSTTNKKESIAKIIKNILSVSIPIALCALFSATTKTIDALTVVRILKDYIGEEVATIQYGILSGKVDTLITLPFSFNIAFATALVPTISSAIAKREINTAEKRIKFSILVTILIGLPCSIYMCAYSNQILYLLFPNASAGGEMLKCSAWIIIFVVLTQTVNGALQGLGKVNVPVIAFAIGAIIKLILNVILIPMNVFGVRGAIISSILSHSTSFIICFISLKKNMNIKFEIDKFLVKPIIASVLMFIGSYVFYNNLGEIISKNILLILSLMFGGIIYITSILCLRILSEEEIFMIPYGQKVYKKLKETEKHHKNARKISVFGSKKTGIPRE